MFALLPIRIKSQIFELLQRYQFKEARLLRDRWLPQSTSTTEVSVPYPPFKTASKNTGVNRHCPTLLH